MNEQSSNSETQDQTSELPELTAAELELVVGGRFGINRPPFHSNTPKRRR
jgi:hypothetical protein